MRTGDEVFHHLQPFHFFSCHQDEAEGSTFTKASVWNSIIRTLSSSSTGIHTRTVQFFFSAVLRTRATTLYLSPKNLRWIRFQCSALPDSTRWRQREQGGGGRRESRSIRGGNNEQRERGREGEISIMGARRGENQWEAQIQWPPGGCFCFSLRQQLSSSWRTTPSFIHSRAHTSEGRREGRTEEEGELHSQWPTEWSGPPVFGLLLLPSLSCRFLCGGQKTKPGTDDSTCHPDCAQEQI